MITDNFMLRKLPHHSADILLLDLPVLDQLLHDPGLGRALAEYQDPRGESVQSMNCVQMLVSEFLGEDEDDSVVSVSATRMNRNTRRFVNHHPVIIFMNHLHLLICHRKLVSMNSVRDEVIVLNNIINTS